MSIEPIDITFNFDAYLVSYRRGRRVVRLWIFHDAAIEFKKFQILLNRPFFLGQKFHSE